jgi:hypothetical protein
MNKHQENKLSMYKTTRQALQNNTSVWEKVPAIVTTFKEFETSIEEIENLLKKQSIDLTGITQTKEERLSILADAAMAIAGPLHAFASQMSNSSLMQKVNIFRSDILDARDSTVIELVQIIADTAKENLTSLADFGINQASITDLQEKVDDFNAITSAPRISVTERKVITIELEKGLEETADLLNERLDKLIEQFKTTEPTFYDQYQNARIIVDSGIRHEEPKAIEA